MLYIYVSILKDENGKVKFENRWIEDEKERKKG